MKRTWSQVEDYGEFGIIESVSLRNFMCHENLTFEFDPHINFIVGLNGSGKSAVLTGIILALGGKSGTTGRYSNIKGFIKTGKNSATVSVTLKNCGPDAYKPEEFGKKITVERYFTQDGSSSYKLKSESGRIISTSKEELLYILSVMNIQIDNPITVLTQETSRNFLFSTKPEKLFKLFYKSTGLAKVHSDYNRSAQHKSDAKMELHNKKAVLPELEKEVQNLKCLLNKSSEVTELQKEWLWAVVIDFEKKKRESQEAFEKVQKEVMDLEKKINSHQAELTVLCQTIADVQDNEKAVKSLISEIRKDFSELEKKKKSLSTAIREIKGQCSSHERNVKRYSSEIVNLEKIIEDTRLKKESHLNAAKLRHEMTMDNLKKEIIHSNNRLELLQSQKDTLRESCDTTTNKINTCQAELGEITCEKDKIMREKEQLTEGLNNRISVFGKEMVNVLKDIKRNVQAGKFQVEPKGPIGLYVTVKQPEWNFAVQECLQKGFLRTFLCDNHTDADLLTSIFKKHYQRNQPSIITSKFVTEVYDVSSNKTTCEYPTVLDTLIVEDPVITNCLIDQMQIENILLIPESKQALNLMLYNPPKNCWFAYTLDGDQYCHSPFRNYSCWNKNQVCMLKTVNEDDIRLKDEELSRLDKVYAEKMSVKDSLTQQFELNQQEINSMDNEIAQLKIKINQMQLKLEEEENNYEQPKDIDCLNNDLVQLQKQKEHSEECVATSKQELNSKTVELNTLTNNIDTLRKELLVQNQNYHTFHEEVIEHQNKKEKVDALIVKFQEKLKDMQPRFKECEKEMLNCTSMLEKATKTAGDVGPRIDTTRSPDTIQQILKEKEQFIQNQKNCNREALVKEFEEKIQNLNNAKQELVRLERINSKLDTMMAKRFQEFQKIRANTSVSLTCCFNCHLEDRNLIGYPSVNFKHETLNIFVHPDNMGSRNRSMQHNLSQLSGGERSYVTIALLLSLWNRNHMPFRILDEYDIFMDSDSRHLSIEKLIKEAMNNTCVQYIFLTPQELPFFEYSDHVKIHKMPSPRQ